MNIALKLKELYHWLDRKDTRKKHITVSSQLNYLSKLKYPKNDYDRAYNQFKCQMYLMSRSIKMFSNIGSFFALIPYIVILSLHRLNIRYSEKHDAIYIQNGIDKGIIPESIKSEYESIKECAFTDEGCLGFDEIKILLNSILRHPLSPYMNMKIAMKLSLYKAAYIKYKPQAIISYCETSFASAIATMWCENRNILHINVQHGDFLKNIKFAGFRFSVFYVWDAHYERMFKSLGNIDTKYKIEICDNLMALSKKSGKTIAEFDLCYYLGDERHEQLAKVENLLSALSDKGMKCKVRLHPRETSEKEAKDIFKFPIIIEYPREINLNDSANNSYYICSQYSTVLLQAYFGGRKIVIDDCTDPTVYNSLKDQEYILLDKDHLLLSALISEG